MGIRHSFANALTPPNSKLNNEDKELFFKHFYLVDAARVLRNSRFLEELTSDPNLLNSERKEKKFGETGATSRRSLPILQNPATCRYGEAMIPTWEYSFPLG
jgi:hypothetical protein